MGVWTQTNGPKREKIKMETGFGIRSFQLVDMHDHRAGRGRTGFTIIRNLGLVRTCRGRLALAVSGLACAIKRFRATITATPVAGVRDGNFDGLKTMIRRQSYHNKRSHTYRDHFSKWTLYQKLMGSGTRLGSKNDALLYLTSISPASVLLISCS
ncbi:hypothetical protein FRC19_001056 [Serendipita sp. 401]|nr:hypothetical protein FRC19_001056 [Serendipita sp. 401]